MNDYKVSDYSIFDNVTSTTNGLISQLQSDQTTITACHTALSNESVFMGPISESCTRALNKIDRNVDKLIGNFTTMNQYISEVSANYQSGDEQAKTKILSTGEKNRTEIVEYTPPTVTVKSSVDIPKSIDQADYTVTCYGKDGFYWGGGDTATPWASSSNQGVVHDKWVEDGGRYKNGIAVMNVDGEDRYLIATTGMFGQAGDRVNVNLENGETVPCVLADIKGADAGSDYGHAYGNQVNIVEFEVDKDVFNSKGNPKTSTWGLEWDSSSNVASIDNCGSAIK